jgi:hypothetical protein
MSTRSNIAKIEADGSVTSIYCHLDGYPSNNGAILLVHYKDESKVNELLSGGSLSILNKDIGERHHFDDHHKVNKYKNMCLYYGRDRRQDDVGPRKHASVAEFMASDREEYTYLLTPDGWMFCGHDIVELVPLTEEACDEDS